MPNNYVCKATTAQRAWSKDDLKTAMVEVEKK